MRFARVVFTVAGVWGLLLIGALYFAFDLIGTQYPPAITHPDFYFGFLAVTLAWQVAFLLIAADPLRQRPIMIAAMLEKFVYVATLIALFAQGRIEAGQVGAAIPDVVFGLLFVAAYLKTAAASASA